MFHKRFQTEATHSIRLGTYGGVSCEVHHFPDHTTQVQLAKDGGGEIAIDPEQFFRLAMDAMRATSLLEVQGSH